jgi:hypothetical protein
LRDLVFRMKYMILYQLLKTLTERHKSLHIHTQRFANFNLYGGSKIDNLKGGVRNLF